MSTCIPDMWMQSWCEAFMCTVTWSPIVGAGVEAVRAQGIRAQRNWGGNYTVTGRMKHVEHDEVVDLLIMSAQAGRYGYYRRYNCPIGCFKVPLSHLARLENTITAILRRGGIVPVKPPLHKFTWTTRTQI